MNVGGPFCKSSSPRNSARCEIDDQPVLPRERDSTRVWGSPPTWRSPRCSTIWTSASNFSTMPCSSTTLRSSPQAMAEREARHGLVDPGKQPQAGPGQRRLSEDRQGHREIPGTQAAQDRVAERRGTCEGAVEEEQKTRDKAETDDNSAKSPSSPTTATTTNCCRSLSITSASCAKRRRPKK